MDRESGMKEPLGDRTGPKHPWRPRPRDQRVKGQITSKPGESTMHERTMRESLIEKYVGYPESLDAETRARVEAYIREDDFAQQIASFYRSYYAALRGTGPHTGDGADPTFDPSTSGLGPTKS